MPPRRDDGDRSHGFDGGNDLCCLIALITDDGIRLLALQQAASMGIFGRLSGRNAEVHRQPGFTGEQMNLGAQSTSGTPQSLVFVASFLRPLAAR